MKAAIIPPHSMLQLAAMSDYHLILPHECNISPRYTQFYAEVEGFKILDNGAAEGHKPPAINDYHALARDLDVNELVVPDVMGDAAATAVEVMRFGDFALPDEFSYMAVLQGNNLEEVTRMLDFYQDMEWIDTVAIPRHLCKKLGDDIRVHLGRIISTTTRFGVNNIHCLGACSWTDEPAALARMGIVRGMDTSLPINYGLRGVRLRNTMEWKTENPIKRPMHYFGATVDQRSETWEIIVDNCKQYLEWAGYEFPDADGDETKEAS
jgi:hypothetical protein